ncbi:MAG: hypothetical protein HY074_15405, partial [Deltaproteobacteria bacterium]|nr:hypothetical protein [Deltaproteobacteria bacterium]
MTYLEINLLLVLGYGALRLARVTRLGMARLVFLSIFLLPPLLALMPDRSLPRPAVQVWSGIRQGT